MKWAVSPVKWHAGNDWAGCCGITTENTLPNLPVRKWRRTTHRSMRCVQETALLLFTKAKMRALCLAAGKRSPTPSPSTEIAPLCQFQSSERDPFAGRPSILTLRACRTLMPFRRRASGSQLFLSIPQCRWQSIYVLPELPSRLDLRPFSMTEASARLSILPGSPH